MKLETIVFILVIILVLLVLLPTPQGGFSQPSDDEITDLTYISPLPKPIQSYQMTTTFFDRYYLNGKRISYQTYVGNRDNPNIYIKKGKRHWDIATIYGTEVYAPCDAKVVHTGSNVVRGPYIELRSDDGTVIIFCHLQDEDGVLVRRGDQLKQKDLIAFTGNQGINCTGSHLHIEVWRRGELINPNDIFKIY